MPYAPRHVANNVRWLSGRLPILGEFDDDHPLCQIVCDCGETRMDALRSDLPRVVARCVSCKMEICVYDIRQYPAATAANVDDVLRAIDQAQDAEVFAMYEYPDLDADEDFDPDDITWCQVYARDSTGKVVQVLDDETA